MGLVDGWWFGVATFVHFDLHTHIDKIVGIINNISN